MYTCVQRCKKLQGPSLSLCLTLLRYYLSLNLQFTHFAYAVRQQAPIIPSPPALVLQLQECTGTPQLVMWVLGSGLRPYSCRASNRSHWSMAPAFQLLFLNIFILCLSSSASVIFVMTLPMIITIVVLFLMPQGSVCLFCCCSVCCSDCVHSTDVHCQCFN